MAEISQEVRDLQKLTKRDLVNLLGELGTELEKFEEENRAMAGRLSELRKQCKSLEYENSDLAEKNAMLEEKLKSQPMKSSNMEGSRQEIHEIAETVRRISVRLRILENMTNKKTFDDLLYVDAKNKTIRHDPLTDELASSVGRISNKLYEDIVAALERAKVSYDKALSAPEQCGKSAGNDGQIVLSKTQAAKLLVLLGHLKEQNP